MEILSKIFERIQGGLMSTILGVCLIVSGWKLMGKVEDLSYDSVELGLFLLGLFFLLISDKWILGLFKLIKKKK
jgi:hypothetical protein